MSMRIRPGIGKTHEVVHASLGCRLHRLGGLLNYSRLDNYSARPKPVARWMDDTRQRG
jgi:hypothetical protein